MALRHRPFVLCLLAAACAPAASAAVYVNSRGSGQALIYPYYSIQAGQSTLLSLTNSTDRAKLVRVLLRESYNGRQVLSFNVALGAHDNWSTTVFASFNEGAGAIARRDNSCTMPGPAQWTGELPGGGHYQNLLDRGYIGSVDDPGPSSLDRTHEGYVEVVELAQLTGALAAAANSGDCAPFDAEPLDINSMEAPGGGLRGSFSIIHVSEGTLFGGNATAIEGVSARVLYEPTQPAATLDPLDKINNNGNSLTALVPSGGRMTSLLFPPARATDALSAVLMTDTLQGDFSHEAGIGSNSEWIVTAPTKRFHTDGPNVLTQLAPFNELFNAAQDGSSCVPVQAAVYDRDGETVTLTGGREQPALCHAVDVVYFGSDNDDNRTDVLGSRHGVLLGDTPQGVEAGSLSLTLGAQAASAARNYLPAGSTGAGLRGLPVIGLQVIKYVNGNIEPGVLANYTVAQQLETAATCVNATGTAIACP
jgi:hypothetical protein